MKPLSSILVCGALLAFAADARAVTIDWSSVGNPGNAADTVTPNPGFGSVGYTYNIGTYDVTNNQYVEFLNEKDPAGLNAFGLYDIYMGKPQFGGINFSGGAADGTKYSVMSGRGNFPANNVNWYDAIRFANWMNNGQGNGDTETGAYTLGTLDAAGVPLNPPLTHNAGSQIWLPTENEWYKAAYYNPGTSSYFKYPTSSNTAPTGSIPTALPNHANISPGGPATLTDVGAYTGTTSPYGAFDMGGNVFQWNESLIGGGSRGLRGGSFDFNSGLMLSSFRVVGLVNPAGFLDDGGFRLASVPEPSTLALAFIGFIGLTAWDLRRRMW